MAKKQLLNLNLVGRTTKLPTLLLCWCVFDVER